MSYNFHGFLTLSYNFFEVVTCHARQTEKKLKIRFFCLICLTILSYKRALSLDEVVNRVQEIASVFKRSEDQAKVAFSFVAVLLGLAFLGALTSD